MAERAEIVVTVTGLDETLSQVVHARHSYLAEEILFGHRFVDIIETRAGRRRARSTSRASTQPRRWPAEVERSYSAAARSRPASWSASNRPASSSAAWRELWMSWRSSS